MKVREVAFHDLHEDRAVGVLPFTEDLSKTWDRFVYDANNGTIFHTRQFLSYHPSKKFNDASLIVTHGDKWLAVVPAVFRQMDGVPELISHAGASFGGPVTKSNCSFKSAFRIVEAILRHAEADGIKRIVMTLPPQFYYSRPSNYMDFALLDSGFSYRKREVSSVIPLDFAEEDTLLVFTPEARRAVRKALKMGVQVRESDDFSTFYGILQRNLKLRHGVKPTHTLDELLTLNKVCGDRIHLFGAFVDEQMVAGLVIFICNHRVALAFYISHNEDLQEYRGVNLLFYQVIRWAIHKQLQFLDFGIFTVNMLPNWGLAKFKESFGAQGVFRDTFSINL